MLINLINTTHPLHHVRAGGDIQEVHVLKNEIEYFRIFPKCTERRCQKLPKVVQVKLCAEDVITMKIRKVWKVLKRKRDCSSKYCLREGNRTVDNPQKTVARVQEHGEM